MYSRIASKWKGTQFSSITKTFFVTTANQNQTFFVTTANQKQNQPSISKMKVWKHSSFYFVSPMPHNCCYGFGCKVVVIVLEGPCNKAFTLHEGTDSIGPKAVIPKGSDDIDYLTGGRDQNVWPKWSFRTRSASYWIGGKRTYALQNVCSARH